MCTDDLTEKFHLLFISGSYGRMCFIKKERVKAKIGQCVLQEMRSNEGEGKGYLWNDDEGNSDAKGYAVAVRSVCEN